MLGLYFKAGVMGKIVKRIVIGLGIVILVLVLAVAALLALVDPNDYRGEIAALAYKATGRHIELGGEIGLKIFPHLAFSVKDVSLAQAEGFGDAPLAHVDDMALSMAVFPLLKGQLQIDAIHLDGLNLALVKDKQGKGNWEAPPGAAKPKAEPEAKPEAESASSPPDTQKDLQKRMENILQSHISSVRVSNCVFSYEDKAVKDSLMRLIINRLELGNAGIGRDIGCAADLRAELGDGMKASLLMDGKVRYDLDGEALSLTVDSFTLGGEAPAWLAARQEIKGSLSARLDGKKSSVDVRTKLDSPFLSGNVEAGLAAGSPRAVIDLKSKPALLIAALSAPMQKKLNLPPALTAAGGPLRSLDLKAELGMQGQALRARNAELRLGGSEMVLTLYSLDAVRNDKGGLDSAEGKLLLQGALRPYLPLAGITPGGKGNEFGKLSTGAMFSLKGENLVLSAVTFKLDDKLVDFSSKRADIRLAPAGPLLPVNAVSADASISARPRELLEALNIKLNTADAAALGQAQASFNLSANNTSLKLAKLNGKLDETDFSATAELLLPGAKGIPKGAKSYAKADLQVGSLNLDRYLAPESAAASEPEAKKSPEPARKEGASSAGPLKGTPLERAAGDFSANIKNLTVKKAPLRNIALNASLAGGVLTVKKAALGAFDGQLEASAKADLVKAQGAGSLKAGLKGLDLGKALAVTLDENRLDGKAEANLDLTFKGLTSDSILGSLSGKGNVKLRNGVLRNFQLIPADAPELLLKHRKGDYSFKDIGASFTAKDGKLVNNDLGYSDSNMSLTGKGSITLLDRKLDYNATLSAKGLAAPVPLRIYGPISGPSITLDVEGLAKQAAQKGEEKLVKELQKKGVLPQGATSTERGDNLKKEVNEKLGKELQKGLENLFKK